MKSNSGAIRVTDEVFSPTFINEQFKIDLTGGRYRIENLEHIAKKIGINNVKKLIKLTVHMLASSHNENSEVIYTSEIMLMGVPTEPKW